MAYRWTELAGGRPSLAAMFHANVFNYIHLTAPQLSVVKRDATLYPKCTQMFAWTLPGRIGGLECLLFKKGVKILIYLCGNYFGKI